MQAAALQNKEKSKDSDLAPSHENATSVDLKEENATEAGMPLFLQRFASSLSTPPPIQRQPDEEDKEQLLQAKPIAPFVQRKVLENEEDINQVNPGISSIQRQTDEEEEIEEAPVFPKLTVGAPNDKYEQEADHVADKVMRMPDSNTSQVVEEEEEKPGQNDVIRTKPITPLYIQRVYSECDEELQQGSSNLPNIQTKSEGSFSASKKIAKILQSPGSGSPLPKHVRSKVEPVLGSDLGHVKVHSDTNANHTAQGLNAKAFTHKNNIYLGKDQNVHDVHLMAHESTHTVQQGATKLSRKPTIGTIRKTNKPVVQRGIRSALGSAWSATGGRAVSYVGGKAKAGYRWGKEQIIGIIEDYVPGLLDLLRGGLFGVIKKKVLSGINALTGGLFNTISEKGLSGLLNGGFGDLLGELGQSAANLSKGTCEAVLGFAGSLLKFAKFIAIPGIKAIKSIAGTVGKFFGTLWNDFAKPALTAIPRLAGSAWEWMKNQAQEIWDKLKPIRETISRAWNWLKEKFGIAWGGSGDVFGWFKEKAIAVWESIKDFIKPILGPIKKVATVVKEALLTPILRIWQGLTMLWEGLKWVWENWGRKVIVDMRHTLHKKILPNLKTGLQLLRNKINAAIAIVAPHIASILEAFSSLLKVLAGSNIFKEFYFVGSFVTDQFQRIAKWLTNDVIPFLRAGGDVAGKALDYLRPIIVIAGAVMLFPAFPWMLPVVIAGWAWRLLPDCFKEPIINFVIDIMIIALRAIPDFRNFGEAWAKVKEKVIGALEQARSMDRDRKLEIANRIAKMMTGEDITWIGNLIDAARQMPDHFTEQVQEEVIGMNLDQPLPFERKKPLTARGLPSAASGIVASELGVLSKEHMSEGDITVDSVASTLWEQKFGESLTLKLKEGDEIEFGERSDEYSSIVAMREEAMVGELATSLDEGGTEGTVITTEEDTEAQLEAMMNQPGPQECVKKAPAEPAVSIEVPEEMKIGPLTRAQRGRYMMNQMWKGIKKWFSCNWKWLVPTLIVAIIGLIAIEILTGGAITAALPAIAQIVGAIFIGVAMIRVAYYLGDYLLKGIAGDVIGAAKSLARGLAVGAVELVFALLFNLGAIIKSMKEGFKASIKAAAGAAKKTVTGVMAASKQLRRTMIKGAGTAVKNIRRISGAVLREGKLVMKGVGRSIGSGVRSLDDLARKLWRRVRFRKFKIRRVGRIRFQLWGYINPWALLADGSIEQVEVKGGGRLGEFVEIAGRRKAGILVGIRDTDASAFVKYIDDLGSKHPTKAKNLYKELENMSDDARRLYINGLTQTAENARILRANMMSGKVRSGRGATGGGNAAHHIVPSTHGYGSANRARKILEGLGIDINGKLNGLFIPPHIHAHLHSHKYMDEVLNRLLPILSLPKASRTKRAEQVLDSLAKDILNRYF